MNARVWLSIALLLLAWAGLRAQESPVDQGSFIIDGTLRISSNSGDDFTAERSASFTLTPSVMYFPVSSFALGVRINIENYKLYGQKVKRSFLGPQIGFYVRMGKKQNYIFSEMSFGLIYMALENAPEEMGFEYSLGLGFLNFISKNIALKGGAEFIKQKVDEMYHVQFFPNYKVAQLHNVNSTRDGNIVRFVVGLSYFIY